VYAAQRARDAGLTIVTPACRSEYDDYEDAVGDEVFVSGPATSTSNNPFVVAVDDDLTPVSAVDVRDAQARLHGVETKTSLSVSLPGLGPEFDLGA